MPSKKTATKTAATPKRLFVTSEGLNVREAPTLQAKVVDILSRSDIVQWISTSDDSYFHKISHNGTEGWASHKDLQFETTPAPASNYPWFEIAHAEIETREVTGSRVNPRIVAYHRSTSLDAPSAFKDETPWCSSFVNYCVERSRPRRRPSLKNRFLSINPRRQSKRQSQNLGLPRQPSARLSKSCIGCALTSYLNSAPPAQLHRF